MERTMECQRGSKLKTILCVAIVAVYVLSLIPVLAAARWNVPHSDDVLAAEELFDAYEATGALSGVADQAWFMMVRFYRGWQGTFANALLCYAGEFLFAFRYPAVTPYLMLAALTLSAMLLFRILLAPLGADRRTRLILTFTALFFMVQQLPSAMESFFWFSSALLYTGSWCFACCLAALLARAARAARTAERAACGVGAAVVAVLIGGGAYPLLPPVLLILTGVLALSAAKHNRPAAVVCGAALLAFLLAAGANVLAPGNRMRMGEGTGVGAAAAVLLSLKEAAQFLAERLDAGLLLFLLLSAFLTLPLVRKTAFRFRLPWLVSMLSFGVYASFFTATLYTTGSVGPGRVQNLYAFAAYPLLFGNTVYWLGAVIRRFPRMETRLTALSERLSRYPAAVLAGVAVLAALSLFLHGPRRTTSYAAVYELATGRLSAYSEMRRAELSGAPHDDSIPQSYLIP